MKKRLYTEAEQPLLWRVGEYYMCRFKLCRIPAAGRILYLKKKGRLSILLSLPKEFDGNE